MTQLEAKRDLLLGLAALERGILDRDGLMTALKNWADDGDSSLGMILSKRGVLTEAEHSNLENEIASRLTATLWQGSGAEASTRSGANLETTATQDSGRASATTSADSQAARRYQILRPHAQGGLGLIYLAVDTELGRKVALKEIRPKHAARAVSRRRFVTEARITSRLEHPGIVPVHGMGRHPDGRPFYAMRFIDGENLATAIHRFHTTGADFQGAEFRSLLRRFIDVCETVAYAHSRGVLHRDLKPSNIMLGPFGETMVLDWGVAKAVDLPEPPGLAESPPGHADETWMGQSLEERVETVTGNVVGTPAYMSPEQASGLTQTIGPWSDVYSLGVTLYVLLSDERPFYGEFDEIRACVQARDFLRPRERNPRIPPALEAVCLRAMALAPEDRYACAQQLGEEIERFLADEPVAALPDPWLIRLQRFARRRRPLVAAGFTAAAVALAALAVAVPLLTVAWQSAEHERGVALAHKRNAEDERDRAASALQFLVSAFRRPDPTLDGRSLRIVDLLDQAVRDLENVSRPQPLMSATLLAAIGQTYSGLGLAHESLAAFEKALALRTQILGANHPSTLASLQGKAQGLQDLGRLDQAIPILESTLEARQRVLGPTHQDTIESQNDLAVAYWQAGRLDEAVNLQQRTLDLVRGSRGEDDLDTLTIMDNLGVAEAARGRPDKAIPLHMECLTRLEQKLGPDHPTTLVCLNNLGRALEAAGQFDEAIRINRQALDKLKTQLQEDHPTTLTCMNGLARILDRADRPTEAITLYRKVLGLREERLGPDHPDTLSSLGSLALLLARQGLHDEAIDRAHVFLDRAVRLKPQLPEKTRELLRRMERLVAPGVGAQTSRN